MQLAPSKNYQGSPQASKPPKPVAGTSNGQSQPQLVPKKMIEHYSYVLQDQIGKGFSSKVFKGKNEKTGETVAVKVIDMKLIQNEIERKLLNQEIHALRLMSSPNVLKMYDCFHTQNNTYIITEHCNQGDLSKLIQKCGPIPEQEAQKIMKHIINGFKEQVRKRVIHRDLKPSNIFLKNGVPKIADYGFSKMMDEPKEKFYYNVGTPLYMCPQSIMQNKYSEKSDIWSIGVIFYELLYGTVPWNAPSEKDLARIMIQTPLSFNPNVPVSEEAKSFIRECLTVEEDQRINLKGIEQHPLFMRRNTTSVSKPRALQNNTQNVTDKHLQIANRSLSNHAKEKILHSPERGQTAYAKLQTKAISIVPSLSSKKPVFSKGENNKIEEEELDQPLRKGISYQTVQMNDEVISSQLYFIKFLFRIAKIVDHYNTFETPCLKEKLLFFIIKNIMIKLTKLKDMVEKLTNPLGLSDFSAYLESQHLQKFKTEILENYSKFKESFSSLWNQIQTKPELKDNLIKDRKFNSICDQTLLEFESFYIFLQSLLKQSIKELNQILTLKLESYSNSEPIEQDVEALIILLDYLVTYYQLCQIITQNFENHQFFAKRSKMQQIAEGRPSKLEKEHFNQIHLKINELKI